MSDRSYFYPWIVVAYKILKQFGGIDNFHTKLATFICNETFLNLKVPEFYRE